MRDLHLRAQTIVFVAVAIVLLASMVGDADAQDRRKPAERRGYVLPQIEPSSDGVAILMWARPVTTGYDLLLARRADDGSLGEAQRLNADSGDVRIISMDEARPALATDDEGRVGAAWVDRAGHIVAIRSEDGGVTFGRPSQLDQGRGRPEHAFVDASFDPRGSLHVAWLDTREAPKNMEEPAQVYHAELTVKRATDETNLSAGHFESVCGCCRPMLRADRFGIEVGFRGIDDEGYRDIYQIRRDVDGDWGSPVRIGPPTWKIDACPMAGPASDGRVLLWVDGSRRHERVVEGTPTGSSLRTVLEASRTGQDLRSPRFVAGSDGDSEMLLIPGTPHGTLMHRDGGVWVVLNDQMPPWCNDALRLGGAVLLLGDDEGRLRLEALDLQN